jgi:excisionase family DNA binding protein
MTVNSDVLRVEELCERLKVSVSTLYRWRRDGIGPKFRKEGRNIFYRWADVQKWINQDLTNGYR